MQVKNEHNLKEDLFSRSVRGKLDNFHLPVEEADWIAMHNRIKHEKRKQTVFRLIWGGGMIAAVGLLFFYFASIPSVPSLEELPAFSEEIPVIEKIEQKAIPQIYVARGKKTQHLAGIKPVVSPFSIAEEGRGDEQCEEQVESISLAADNLTQKEEGKNSVTDQFLAEPVPDILDALSGKLINHPIRKNRWKISTGLAGGSGIRNDGFSNNYDGDYHVTDPGPGGSDQEPPPDEEEKAVFTKAGHREIQDLLDQRNYTETHHTLPVSFALAVRSRITKKVSVETGLVYTYLSSRMEQYGQERITTRIKQHYIGIPLNVVVDVWQHAQWHWYISGGGMIEKGIRLAVNEEIISVRPEYIERRSGMDGVQGSLQLSSGIEYALSRQWSLYIEPRFSYYFDNNQPVSIRTERPLVVSLGGGLRYSF